MKAPLLDEAHARLDARLDDVLDHVIPPPRTTDPDLPFRVKAGYSVGHVLNDLCAATWFTAATIASRGKPPQPSLPPTTPPYSSYLFPTTSSLLLLLPPYSSSFSYYSSLPTSTGETYSSL